MDAINLQGIWPNFPDSVVIPPGPDPSGVMRRGGFWNPDFYRRLIMQMREDEEREREAEEKRRLKRQGQVVRRRQTQEARLRREYARAEATHALEAENGRRAEALVAAFHNSEDWS
jgi:hypothetical protein